MPRGYPGSTPGVDPRSQGVIPRRFKQKKIFVTDVRTDGRTDERKLDRRDGRNSYLDGTMSDGFFYMWRFVRRRLDFLIVAFLQEYRYTTTKL